MSGANTQAAVTDTKASAEPDAKVTDARNDGDDLDALLAEFDQGTKKTDTATSTTTTTTTTVDPRDDRIKALENVVNEISGDRFKADIAVAVKAIRGDISTSVVDDDIVEAWLDTQARKDTRLQNAWMQRANNPKAWQRIQGELGRAFRKKFDKMPDAAVTEDRDAVAAAVRGSSTKAPEDKPVDYSRMSTAEYRKSVIEQYGFDPSV